MSLQFAGEVSMLNEQGEHSGMLIHRDSWNIRSLQGFSISEFQVLMVSLRKAKTVAGLWAFRIHQGYQQKGLWEGAER